MFKPALLSSLKTYTKQTFLADLFAGLTVGVVAIPLAMAFAIACGLSPTQGLITAIVAGFLISLFSGSKYQIGGPTGAFVIIIMGVLEQYHASGLLVCTLMAGLFLIIFGFCRMGALIRFIPFPVTTGFTSGIAVVIFSTQIKDIFGLTITEKIPGEFIEKWACYFHYFHTINWAALGLAAGTVIITLLSRRFWPRIPAMLVGMLGMTAVSVAFSLPVTTIGQAFGSLPNTLPLPSLPSIDWSTLGALTAPAFTIALLAAIESLLSASVADGMTGGRHKPNMELIAQGIGNIGSALFGGIPATGAIARTATNIKAGAKSPVSGMIHALTLLAILMAFAHYAQQIPLAVLPGIQAAIVDESGNEMPNGSGGILVIKKPWPSMIRTIWNDPERFKKSYFPEELKGYYLAGDGAVRAADNGYFRITGRIDDVLNVSGHRMGTMEIESALVSKTDLVAEAAVVGRPDDTTGEAICAFVVLKRPLPQGDEAKQIAKELRDWVAKEIGPIAKPKDIRFGENLPKTRSGKIMRRLLRSLAKGEQITQDTTTLENPAILTQLDQTY